MARSKKRSEMGAVINAARSKTVQLENAKRKSGWMLMLDRVTRSLGGKEDLPWLFALAGIYSVALYKLSEFKSALPKYLPIDDSYIILNFARNVAERHEFFSYNPGEISTGITSPLYCLALALTHFFCGEGDASWHTAVVSLGTICFIAALLLGSRLAYRMAGYPATLCFAAFFGFWGYMGFFAFCGMEPILYIALAFGAFLLFIRHNYFCTGLVSGLAMLCRPEAVFFVLILGLVPGVRCLVRLFRRNWGEGRSEFLKALCFGIGFLAVAIPWMLRCYQVSGGFMPSTVAVKTGSPAFKETVDFWITAIHMFKSTTFDASIVKSVVGETTFILLRKHFPLMIPAACALFFLRKKPEFIAPFMYIPVHLLVAGFKNPHLADNERYFPFDYALTLVYLAVFFSFLTTINWRSATSTFRSIAVRNTLRLAAAGTALALSFVILSDYSRNVMHYRIMSQYFYNLDYQIGEWLAKNTPPDTCVALFQAGGIGFFGRRRIIDGGAVTEHTIWPYLKRKAYSEAMVDRGADYVASFGDEWLVYEGLNMRDARFFTQVPLRCRGLYKINKPALAQFVAARKQANPASK